jgi:CheY-like chemotaxis protein
MIETLRVRHLKNPTRLAVECRFAPAFDALDAGNFAREIEALTVAARRRGASFEGLADAALARQASLALLRGAQTPAEHRALLPAGLAAALLERLGGGGALEVGFDAGARRLTMAFSGAGDFAPSFAMLYSLSLLRTLGKRPGPEPRLAQLLEVAQVFFGSQDAPKEEDALLGGLSGQVPQEALGSFVNFIHPHPDYAGNLIYRILLLEDNRTLAEILGDMLASFGFVVCPAYDGVAGLARLEDEAFDLVLSDIQMPRLDGMSLLKVLRGLKLELPVILMTGYTGIWEKERALRQGAVDFLPKPFAMEELLAAVRRALEKQPAG